MIATDQAEKKYAQTSPASSRVLEGRKVVPTPKSIMTVAATHEITDKAEKVHRLRRLASENVASKPIETALYRQGNSTIVDETRGYRTSF
jgi:hypothetical protein